MAQEQRGSCQEHWPETRASRQGRRVLSIGNYTDASRRDLQNKPTNPKWIPAPLPQWLKFIWPGLDPSTCLGKSYAHNSHVQPGLGSRGGGGSDTREVSSPDKSPPTTKQCGQDLVFDLQGHPDLGLVSAQPSVVKTFTKWVDFSKFQLLPSVKRGW